MPAKLTYQDGIFRIHDLSIEDFLPKLAEARRELGINNPGITSDPETFGRFYAEHLKCTEPVRVIARHWDISTRTTDELLLFYYFVPDYDQDTRPKFRKNPKTESELEFRTEMALEKLPVPPEIKVVYGLGASGSVSCDDEDIWNDYIERVSDSVSSQLKEVFPKGTRFQVEFSNFAVKYETEYYML
jgi:hypothetical protein